MVLFVAFFRAVLLITTLLVTAYFPAQAQAPEFPFDVQLVKPLGFRMQPGLDAAPVLPNRNYLQPPTRITVLGATGSLWQAGTFCHVQYSGKQGFIRCDAQDLMTVVDTSSGGQVVSGQQCTPSMESGPFYTPKEPPTPGRNAFGVQFCKTEKDCIDFCAKHCTFCANKWQDTRSGNDGATSCPTAPTTGEGLLPREATIAVPIDLPFIRVPSGERASENVVRGLTDLNTFIAQSPDWQQTGYKVKVHSCYRSPAEETEKICNLILKGTHMLNKFNDTLTLDKKKQYEDYLNPPENKGLTWPGANPHSAAQACDMVVLDQNGREWFDSAAGPGTQRNSPEQLKALKMLDEAVTTSGGRRLVYEAWHYEWGNSAAGSRCTYPNCPENPCGNKICR